MGRRRAACSGQPRHPYTQGLLGSMPRLAGSDRAGCRPSPARCRARSSGRPAAPSPTAARARSERCRERSRRSHGRPWPRLRLLEPGAVTERARRRSSRSRTWSSISRSRAARIRARERRELRAGARRDDRHRRRIGLRQVDARPHRAAPDRADRGHAALSTARTCCACRRGRCAGAGATCRSSSRTPTPRSIRACGSARASRSR